MAKIKDTYRVLLGKDLKRFHMASTLEQAQIITLDRNIDNKAVFDNTVVSIGEFTLVTLIGDKDVSDVSNSQLTLNDLDYWQFELMQGTNVAIKSSNAVIGGTVTFKVSANDDFTFVVRGIASTGGFKLNKK